MTTTLSFIVVLGVLITAHEVGHFLAAKSLGIGVDRFSIGFPPKMFGFRAGRTEYCVSWIPLGGYVKLRGEDPADETDPSDPTLYSSRSPLQRSAVILAGPLTNLLLAFLVMPLVFAVGMEVPAYLDDPVVAGWVVPDSPADRAGLRPGDEVFEAAGRPVRDWEAFYEASVQASAGPLALRVRSKGEERLLDLEGGGGKAGRELGIVPPLEPVVGALTSGFPAERAGLLAGDRIVRVGGLPVEHWSQMAQIIEASGGRSMSLVVRRDGKAMEFEVTPRSSGDGGRLVIGISPRSESVLRRFAAVESMRRGFARNVDLLGMTFGFVWDLVTLKGSIKDLGGPIMIYQVSGDAARAGFSEFLAFLAFLSLQLGILNLLPIPVLDGGHLVFLGIEGVIRRPLGHRFREGAQRVGFALLLLLILVISYNDILRLLGKG